jgi:methyl-accepting chemotaxis protein
MLASRARAILTTLLRIRFGLRIQIALLGIVGVLLTGMICLGGLYLDARAQAESDQMISLRQDVVDLAANYLEAGQIANEFLRKHDESLIGRHAGIVEAALGHLSAIEAFVDQLPDGDALKTTSALRSGINLYQTRFNNIVSMQRALGLNENQGLQGKLRSAVHQAERKLADLDQPRLTNLLLMMRRHEKDFIIRGDEKYGDDFDKRRSEFADVLKGSGLSDPVRNEVSAFMKAYGESFAGYMVTQSSLNEEVADFATVFQRNRPALDTLVKVTGDRYQASQAHAAELRQIMIGTIAAATICIGLVAIFFGQRIAGSIAKMTRAMQKLASGDFAVVLPGLGRADEVGDMAQAVEMFKILAGRKADEEARARMNQELLAADARKADMNRLADEFEGAVGQIIETVSAAAAELEAAAGTLTATAERSSDLTRIVAATSGAAFANVQSVALASDEMSSSVSDVGRQVQGSARAAREAVQQAEKTNQQVGELMTAASKIGEVVQLINSVARQTNLLALNATIEAARAGNAGRGFAVVASEVKTLAQQTAQATDEISVQVGGIQNATQEAVLAINVIAGTIGRMSEVASTIATAVEEQGTAAREISRNVQQAAQRTEQVSLSIADVQRGASETGAASAQVLSAARSLAANSSRLKLELAAFLGTVRAA